jgi:tetratricopeptide (TPR) repeat protein
MNSGREQLAIDDWNASLQQSALHLAEIMNSSQGKLTLRTILEKVLPEQPDMILAVAQQYFSTPKHDKIQRFFLNRAVEFLSTGENQTANDAYTAASVYRLLGRFDEAVPQFKDAIALNPVGHAWIYQYAQMLFDMGRIDDALEQANRLTTLNASTVYQNLKRTIMAKQAETLGQSSDDEIEPTGDPLDIQLDEPTDR